MRIWNAMHVSFFFFLKNKKKVVFFSFNPKFMDLFIGARVGNTVFFGLRNIYWRQS
jgi:hypothetical protein